jgi:hypothetical protein
MKHQLFTNLDIHTVKTICKLGAFLGAAILLLVVLHDQVYQYGRHPDSWLGMAFNLNGEHNIPTWFASICWFGVALTASVAYVVDGKQSRGKSRIWWLVIAAAFMIASCDDVATIHEHVGLYLQNELDHTWLGRHVHQTAEDSPWLMFYIAPLALFGITSAVFIWTRLKQYPLLLLLCLLGATSYGVALLCEQYQGQAQWQCCEIARLVHTPTRKLLNFTVVLEESMEMLGSTLLIMAFSGYSLQKGIPLSKPVTQLAFQPLSNQAETLTE